MEMHIAAQSNLEHNLILHPHSLFFFLLFFHYLNCRDFNVSWSTLLCSLFAFFLVLLMEIILCIAGSIDSTQYNVAMYGRNHAI
jgi:hypothetical protein